MSLISRGFAEFDMLQVWMHEARGSKNPCALPMNIMQIILAYLLYADQRMYFISCSSRDKAVLDMSSNTVTAAPNEYKSVLVPSFSFKMDSYNEMTRIYVTSAQDGSLICMFTRYKSDGSEIHDVGPPMIAPSGSLITVGGDDYIRVFRKPHFMDISKRDTQTNTFMPYQTIQVCEGAQQVCMADGYILYTGGNESVRAGVTSSTSRCVAWNPQTLHTKEISRMPIGRERHHMLLLPDGRVFVYGGNFDVHEARTVTRASLVSYTIYDPVTNTWSSEKKTPISSYTHWPNAGLHFGLSPCGSLIAMQVVVRGLPTFFKYNCTEDTWAGLHMNFEPNIQLSVEFYGHFAPLIPFEDFLQRIVN